tara:strand:- start:368 stop:886 length:519 start_codon:yes stop_codon:yes gene_type:complete
MPLETSTYIDGLVATNPAATDGLAQADDHMRLIKSTILATFPSITGAITATQAELNTMDGITATTVELNTMDGITATTAELNILDGCTITAANLNALSGVTNLANTTALSQQTSPSLGGNLNTNGNSIVFGSWTIELDGTNLLFKYGGDTKIRMTSAGALDVEQDVTAFSGI